MTNDKKKSKHQQPGYENYALSLLETM